MAKHNEVGALGESIAVKFLKKRGLEIIELNHWRKWGEIDIVACATVVVAGSKQRVIHFVEVKTTSKDYHSVSSEQAHIDDWRPEEMLHSNKIKRLKRVIQTYIMENNVEEWVFDVVIVYLNKERRTAKCKYLKDIIL